MMDRTVATRFLAPQECSSDRFRTIRRGEHAALRAYFNGYGLRHRRISSYRTRLGFRFIRRLVRGLIGWERSCGVLVRVIMRFRLILMTVRRVALIGGIVFAVVDLDGLIALVDLHIAAIAELRRLR